MTHPKLALALLGGASAFVVASSACAAKNAEDQPVVTGSRLAAPAAADSAAPVLVIQIEGLLEARPGMVSAALNTLPLFFGSRDRLSPPNATGAAGTGAGGNAAAANLNLRNLGASRTLILLDGKRLAPTSGSRLVDVDMIPQLMLRRVEVVTGGASAIYGADAMSGVVNFITDTHFNGLKATAEAGTSSRGDGREYDAGLALGRDFGDRLHVEAGYEFRQDDGLPNRSSRPGTALVTLAGVGTAAFPLFLTGDTHRADTAFGGLIRSGVLSGQMFRTNGVLSPLAHGVATGFGSAEIGGDGAWSDASLKASLRTQQVFARVDLDLRDDVHAFLEVADTQKRNRMFTTWQTLNNVTISAQNPYLAQAYRTQLASAGQSSFVFSKFMAEAPRQAPSVDQRQLFYNFGIEGVFGHGYSWDLGYVRSSARMALSVANNLNNRRLSAALDAVINPANGQIVCNVSLTASPFFPGCAPLNPFGPGAASAQALAYIAGETGIEAYATLDQLSGSLRGAPFSTWAGPVNMALSGEWRRQATSSRVGPMETDSCIGLRFNCTLNTPAFAQTFSANTSASLQTLREGGFEFDAPLIKDAPLAQAVNLSGAVRYTEGLGGPFTSWKTGLSWRVSEELRFRAARSRDFRAPTIEDLYAPGAYSLIVATDLLVNASAAAPLVQISNPSLRPEVGESTTAGVVYRPAAIPGLTVSLDAFDIGVRGGIIQISGASPAIQRACYASGGASVYCSLQRRPLPFSSTAAFNQVIEWDAMPLNVGKIHTWGADLDAQYETTFKDRPATLRGLVSYQPHLEQTPGVGTVDTAGVASPSGAPAGGPVWRVTGAARFSPMPGLTVDVVQRWRSALRLVNDPTVVIMGPGVKPQALTNLNVAYRLKAGGGAVDLYLNIQNLFDQPAPAASFNGGQLSPGLNGGFLPGDDPVGRYYTLGVRLAY